MFSEAGARERLRQLIDDYYQYSAERRQQFSEADVVNQFLARLFRDVLGWPIEDNDRYKYELSTRAGRPDITFIPESGGTIFIEAKRFGVIRELKQARQTLAGTITPGQMALPGMAVDRTPEEQQAINYAFENGGAWAILTNFERLRLFNARRDWLVLAFETPDALRHDFDLLWQLAYPNLLRGSLDALSSQRHRAEVDTDYLAFINHWRERLARDVLRLRARNPWLNRPDGSIDAVALRDVVQRFLDRLVIIRFAEDHLVIPSGTLYSMYELRRSNPYTFSMDEFIDRLFRQFDQAHNSALFTRGRADDAVFSDGELMQLVEKLYEARYRAMPADILGNTYEQYLGKMLLVDGESVATRDNLETRKKQGSYYTPQVIVRYIVDHSLGRWLYGTHNGRPDGSPLPGETRKTAADLAGLRVLDAACGSGSFLIYAYAVLAEFYERERARLEAARLERRRALAASGLLPTDIEADAETLVIQAQLDALSDAPRLILERHLYGVDLDPQAAEIAVVNLMMRGMERQGRRKRLPLILNQNVKSGNSLLGLRPDDPRLRPHAPALARLIALRAQLTDPRHEDDHERITAALEAETRALAAPFDAEFAAHFADPARAHPFHWGIEFPEVFFDRDGQPLANPGFTVILGNPPWEIVKPDLREFYARFDQEIESRLNRRDAELRIAALDAEQPARRAEWQAAARAVEDFAAYVRRTPDYTRQGRGDTATHKLFLERAFAHLLRAGGRLGYLVPSGIYTDLGTKDLREMLLNEGSIQYIFSFSNERFFFPSVHHSFKFTLLGAQKGVQSEGFWAAFRFNPRVAVAPDDLPAFLANPDNLIHVRRESLAKFSPNSLSLMEFQTRRDYEIAERIYGDWPLLGDTVEGAWDLKFAYEFHMANDAHLFLSSPAAGPDGRAPLPLYEGKMIHQFDAFYAPPRYWIEESKGAQELANGPAALWYRGYRFAFREVASTTNERTCIAAMLPPNTFAGHTLWVGYNPDPRTALYFVSVINSFVVDWIVRFKGGTHVTLFLMKSLPVPRLTAGNAFFDALVPRAARLVCTREEFAGLWEALTPGPSPTRGDEPLTPGPSPTGGEGGKAGETGAERQPAREGAERQRLRDEIDALVAHLYGLTRAEYDHILGTFPLAVPDAARRAALLDAYDALAGVGRG